jgi:hypothetical protein
LPQPLADERPPSPSLRKCTKAQTWA